MKLKEVNYNLFKSAEHLLEAAKFMCIFDKDRADKMVVEADAILSVIDPAVEKVSQDKLSSIMDEIINFGEK